MGERVIIERDGSVAHVKLNRPEKRNGLDLAMFQELAAAGAELASDRSLRAVILHSTSTWNPSNNKRKKQIYRVQSTHVLN